MYDLRIESGYDPGVCLYFSLPVLELTFQLILMPLLISAVLVDPRDTPVCETKFLYSFEDRIERRTTFDLHPLACLTCVMRTWKALSNDQ